MPCKNIKNWCHALMHGIALSWFPPLLSDNILDIHRHLHTVIFHLINCSSQFRQVIKGYKDLQDCVSMWVSQRWTYFCSMIWKGIGIAISVLKFCLYLSFVTIWKLKICHNWSLWGLLLIEFFSLVPIWVIEFFHYFSFWFPKQL